MPAPETLKLLHRDEDAVKTLLEMIDNEKLASLPVEGAKARALLKEY